MQYILVLVVGIALGFGLGRVTSHPATSAPAAVESSETTLAPGLSPPVSPSPAKLATFEKKEGEALPPTATATESPVGDDAARDEERDKPGYGRATERDDRDDRTFTPKYPQMDSRVIEQIEKRRKGNALSAIQNAQPVNEMSATLKGLLGVFEGDILIDENTGRTWQIRMETDGKIVSGTFQGTSHIQLSRNGRVFSNSKNDGSLKNLRYSGSKASVWIEMGDFYLDAIYDAQTDALVGNFYGRNPKGDYRYRGYASLNRR